MNKALKKKNKTLKRIRRKIEIREWIDWATEEYPALAFEYFECRGTITVRLDLEAGGLA